MTWRTLSTFEKIGLIQEHWMDGFSAADIAHSIGARLRCEVTRNAIIGMYGRYRDDLIKFPLPPAARSKKNEKQKVPVKRREPSRIRPKVKAAAEPIPQKASETATAAPGARFVPLWQLADYGECKWPVNDALVGEVHLFCGRETEIGKPYCEAHAQMSVGPGTVSERRVVKVSARLVA